MSCDGIAIRVRDLAKHYFLYERPQDRLKQSIVPRLQRLARRAPSQYYRAFAALDGVSFDVRRGETVGIVGRNGAGKSTLLQLICGTLAPSAGRIEVGGRLAALLELGAGFNPQFTGRENVYVNGAVLGLSRAEIDARFAAIAAFADIGRFMDQPVKTYSSGMHVRLAFAVAISIDPEVLVVDEALAVGDEPFQRKCFARIEEIQARGGTILFVSHSLQTILQVCSRALLLDAGELLLDGDPKLVTTQYLRLVGAPEAEAMRLRGSIRRMNGNGAHDPDPRRTDDLAPGLDASLVSTPVAIDGPRGATISNIRFETESGRPINQLISGRVYVLCYDVAFSDDCRRVGFAMGVRTTSAVKVLGAASYRSPDHTLDHAGAGSVFEVRFRFTCILNSGVYFATADVHGDRDGTPGFLHRLHDALAFRVTAEAGTLANGLVDAGIVPSIARRG
jgi:lipopolysaccharide transport system ATP-binding protein